jgi:hypothetical protein
MTGIDAPTIVTERREIVKTLKNLITEHSLPLWSGEGWDLAAGGFVEKLDRGQCRSGAKIQYSLCWLGRRRRFGGALPRRVVFGVPRRGAGIVAHYLVS